MSSLRDIDRAAERRWPSLFRYDLRQALWLAVAFQVVAILMVFFSGDHSAMPAVPLMAGTVGLLTRGLWESRKPRTTDR